MHALDGDLTAVIADLNEARPDLVRLAESLCLAASVERAFLRRARLRFLPRSTAGLEAELWFSPLVEAAGDQTLLLDPGVSEVLRHRLTQGPLEHAWAVREFTEEAHREAPPVVRWFEELLWAGVFPSADGHQIVQDELRRMLHAVTVGGDDEADDLGRWALHYLPRLPAGLLRHDDAWRIQVASAERLGLEPPYDPFSRPESITAGARALVRREVAIGVTARSGGVVLSSPPASDALAIRASGGRKVRLDVVSVLEPPPSTVPARLELQEDQSVFLPFTVIQRLNRAGQPVMSVAHAGGAVEVAVAAPDWVPGAMEPGWPYVTVLMRDGTIVLYGDDGAVIMTVPRPPVGATRRSVALSADGTSLAWIEDGDIHRCEVGIRPGPAQVLPGQGEVSNVWFPRGHAEDPMWASHSLGRLTLRGPGLLDHVIHDVRGGVRALWPFSGGGAVALLDDLGSLWLYDNRDALGQRRLLSRSVTAVSGHGDGECIVAARTDGAVLAWSPVDPDQETWVGSAPWEVTDLAVSTDGGSVAAVGADARLLICGLRTQRAFSRQVRVAFAADRVFAHPSGGWTVAGSGGPIELRSEDGRRHVVTPDYEPDLRADDVPAWIRGRVIAEIDSIDLWGDQASPPADVMRNIAGAGVQCIVVGPLTPPPLTGPADLATTSRDDDTPFDGLRGIAPLIEAASLHGVRVVVDLHLTNGEFNRMGAVTKARVYDGTRRWLDQGVDGVQITGGQAIGQRFLNDLHHLLQGYDDRVLVGRRPWAPLSTSSLDLGGTGARTAACHVVMLSLDVALAQGIRNADLGSDAPSSYGAQLMEAHKTLATARHGAQWGHTLPKALDPAQRRLAAAVLLGLPGCPVLPLELLQESGTAAMLELRRAHLALSRGTCGLRRFDHPEVLGVLRAHGSETILCLANSATERRSVSLTSEVVGREVPVRLLDLFDGSEVECGSRVPATVEIHGGGVRWMLVAQAFSTAGPRG
ncbi:DUF3459 domain-containing protein [Streptomyces sp. NPDC004646]